MYLRINRRRKVSKIQTNLMAKRALKVARESAESVLVRRKNQSQITN